MAGSGRTLGAPWSRVTLRLVLGDIYLRFAWHFCVAGAVLGMAGVVLGDIYLRFAWQAWRLVTSTFVLRGRRVTSDTWLGLVARLGPPWSHVTPRHFCVAGVALGDIHLR